MTVDLRTESAYSRSMAADPGETFEMTSDPDELATMRAWLRRELDRHAIPAADQAGLLVATGELCANSIKHAYDGVTCQPIRVSLRALGDRIVIEVEDFGRSFEPARYRPPDLDTVPEHGLGLFLARQSVDDLSFDVSRARGTRWTLIKYRSEAR